MSLNNHIIKSDSLTENENFSFNNIENIISFSDNSIYSHLNNRDFLLSISNNQEAILTLDKITQGYIYYLFLKHNIDLDFSKNTVLTQTNYIYFFKKFKKQFSLQQLMSTSKFYDEKTSFLKERQLSTFSFNSETIFSDLLPIINDTELEEVEDIYISQNNKFFSTRYAEILSNNNGLLNINLIVMFEDFFLEAISFNDNIKDDIIQVATNEDFDYSSIYMSDSMFYLLAPFLIKNTSCKHDYKFKARFLQFLKEQCRVLFSNISDNHQDDAIYFFSLINKFTFHDEPEHIKFLTNLIECVSKHNPDFLFNAFNIIDLDVEDIDNFIFQLTFPIFSQNTTLADHPYTKQQFIDNKDFIRDTLQDQITTHNILSYSSINVFLNKYYDIFNFPYLNGNFNDEIFSKEFEYFLLNLKGNDIFGLFSYSFKKSLNPKLGSDAYFLKKYISLIFSLEEKTKDLFEDYFNHQDYIQNLLNGYAYNILNIKEEKLLESIDTLFSTFHMEEYFSQEEFVEKIQNLNKYCHTNHILNENSEKKIGTTLTLKEINYETKSIYYSLELPNTEYFDYKSYSFGGTIGVFSKQYFHIHKARIKENVISHFLYTCRNELLGDFEIKPTHHILHNMLPPGANSSIPSVTKPIATKTQLMNLNDVFELLFSNNEGLKQQTIQRILFVFYFNNPLFDFINTNFQEQIRKEINLFLFKHYSFDHGYNFSKENIKSDFPTTFNTIADSRNNFIKTAYLFSSPKFASRFLLNKISNLESLANLFPDNTKFINTHIVPLLKSFYLNLSMIIDFKIPQYHNPYYKKIFQVISKILLVELFETNLQRFKPSDLTSIDILNYLFSNHNNINIQKLQLYPELKTFIKEIGYQVILENELDTNFLFLKKSLEGFKKFFILSLFIADNKTVADIINNFYNNQELHVLQEMFENNNLMFNFSPQVFSQEVIDTAISTSSVTNHLRTILENTFISNNKFVQPSLSEMDSFNKLVSETSYLYKYGFLTEKLSLPDSIKNHINDFFSSVFAFTPTNSQITQQHINLFNIFDFNINELKTFFLEKSPYIFLTHSLDTFIFHFDLFQYFSISKEEMLQFIKKTFSEIKNEHYFDIFFDFNRKEPIFQSWIKSIVSENEQELFLKESENIYLYFWKNSNDCPELRVYLLKINLFLKIFSYDMDNILSKSKNIIKKDFPNSIYTEENDTKSSNFTNYFLFYSYIFTEKLKISQSEFENILSSIDIKYKTFYHDNHKNYVKSSYFFYLTLMDHMHYNQGSTASHNFFFAPTLFRNTIIDFYSNLNFSHFLFQKRFNLLLPHEQNNSSIFTLTTHLQHSVDIQKMLFNFQLNISRISTSDLSIKIIDKSYEELNGFFKFLFECILAQSGDGGHQTITDTLEFIVFNLRLVDFLPKVYNAYAYSNLICTPLSIDYAKELRKQNLFTIVKDSSPTKPIKVKKKI